MLNEHRDWSKVQTKTYTKRVWCNGCMGTGQQRLRAANGLTWKPIRCRVCSAFKKIFVEPGGKTDKICSQIVPGLWKWGNSYGSKTISIGRK